MLPEVSDLIRSLLEDTDKHIEVADGHHNTEKNVRYNKSVAAVTYSQLRHTLSLFDRSLMMRQNLESHIIYLNLDKIQ